MTLFLIDIIEKRTLYISDILRAFIQLDWPANWPQYLCFTGMMMDMIFEIDPSCYADYVTNFRGKQVLYAKFNKAVYGTLLGGILFYGDLPN